jgi:hypothetical protein
MDLRGVKRVIDWSRAIEVIALAAALLGVAAFVLG